ncbi:MAG: hypothetical protein AB7S26_00920 [Sandaracinaceae bacterium]
MNALDLAQRIHGHLGVLAAIALLHPAILLRNGAPLSRGARWSVGLTAGVTTLAFGAGVSIYESYRAIVKRPLFLADEAAGFLFETKEHLAYAVVALTLGAAVCAFAAPRKNASLRKLAAALFAAAALSCAVVVTIGIYVSAIRNFAHP